MHLTVLRGADSPAGEVAERVYASLEAAGIGVLFDDRGERPGVQFADADLIGLPAAPDRERALDRTPAVSS